MIPTPRPLAPAAFGFAFVAVAFVETFWIAVLCLLGAAVFHAAAKLLGGDMTLGELQERAEAARTGFTRPPHTAVSPSPTVPAPSAPGRTGRTLA